MIQFPLPIGSIGSMARALVFRERAGVITFSKEDGVSFHRKGWVDHLPVRQQGTVTPHYLSKASYGLWARLFLRTTYHTIDETLMVEKSLECPTHLNLLVRVMQNDKILHHQKYFVSSEQEIRELF